MRLIDADVLKQHIDKLPALPDGNFEGNHSALKALINMQPTIEPSTNCSEFPNGSDIISRQQVIDAIVQCTNCGDEDTLREYVLKHSLDNGWTGGILEALDAVKDLPPAQPEVLACGNGELVATPELQWIPCENDLPDIGMTVLFCDIDGDEFIGHRALHWWWSVDEKVKNVIAWMPLPEAYKPNK